MDPVPYFPLIRKVLDKEWRFSPEDKEDHLQSIAIRILRSEGPTRGGDVRGWVRRTTHNHILDAYRSRECRPAISLYSTVNTVSGTLDGDDMEIWLPVPSTEEVDLDLLVELNSAISLLPDDQRIAFLLFVQGYGCRTISEKTGANEVTVRTRVFRAKKKLKRRLAHRDPRIKIAEVAQSATFVS